MKSDIEKFWAMLKSKDDIIYDEGYRLWSEFAIKNPNYFERIKKILPKNFVTVYDKINFHDFHILSIEYYSKTLKSSSIKIVTYDYHNEYGENMFFDFIYNDVIDYSCSITSVPPINWSYDIFEILDEKLFMHRILCSNRIFFDITSKNIEIKSYKSILN